MENNGCYLQGCSIDITVVWLWNIDLLLPPNQEAGSVSHLMATDNNNNNNNNGYF